MTDMPKVALIDGDIIAYSCGFASDGAASKDGMKFEPWGFCRHGVDATINAIKDAVGATEHVVVLTAHGGGYRDDVYPAYKAGRPPEKPHHYHAIRDHLLGFWGGFESTDGKEADDELGILLGDYGEDGIICSKDKDLDCVPGWHYNFSKTRKEHGVYMVTRIEADRFFYTQMLQGDSTDNIPGMWKTLGIKATDKWLSPLDEMEEPSEMYAYVREVYSTLYAEQKAKGKLPPTAVYKLDDPMGVEAFLLFLGTLLWIQRKDGWLFVPPIGPFSGREAAKEVEHAEKESDASFTPFTRYPRGKEYAAIDYVTLEDIVAEFAK
jgi:5'-3' exonuclease